MILKAYIENYGNTAFNIVSNATIKENFDETLDSGVFNITNIETKLELYPFQFVLLKSTDNSFSKYLVIDNFVETIENLDEGIYDYVINLASPLKILEKVQLPNRTVIHSLVESRKKIATVIGELMTLYCPKVKYSSDNSTWDYQYIFDWQTLISDSKLMNTDCPDLSFNAPTLREALTTLMLVVGYLPTINHRTLTFIDLRAKPNNFVIQEGRIYDVKRSNSVDSYVNTLQVQATNVLDTENKVVNEMLGFRDRNNVFLKHTENLKLETRFPIESIEKLELRSFVQLMTSGVNSSSWTILPQNIFSLGAPSTTTRIYANSPIIISVSTPTTLTNVVAKFYYDPNSTIDFVSSSNLITFADQPTLVETRNFGTLNLTDQIGAVISPAEISDYTYIVLSYTYNNVNYKFASFQLVPYGIVLNRLIKKDITDIVFEEGKRKLLSKDFTLLSTQQNYSAFKNYYYLTLSYQYNGKEITGFSNKWNEFTWFGEYDENFMDTLWKAIQNEYLNNSVVLRDLEELLYLPYGILTTSFINKDSAEIIGSTMSPYATFYFNISYRPFNNINVRYTKNVEEVPYTIEQLDKQEASIPMFDEFSSRESDKINRLGNNVVQIHQSQATDFSYIQNLNTLYGDSTVFSREIAFYDDGFEVNYVATKNYVLKNYFTALQTKYRAFEYVDYNQTITRKENTKVFVYIGTTYYNADDYVVYGTMGSSNTNTPDFLYSALLPYTKGVDKSFKYQIDGIYNGSLVYSNYKFYKNDLSVITYKNNLVFTHQCFDSVSEGIYIIDGIEPTPIGDALGGYLQDWYMNANYDMAQICLYTDKNLANLLSNDKPFATDSEVEDFISESLLMPNMNSVPNFADLQFLRLVNSRSSWAKPYYKSQNEVLNQTLQFEFYTDKEAEYKPFFEFSEKFVDINSAVFDRSKGSLHLFAFSNRTPIVEGAQNTAGDGVEFTPYSNYVSEISNRGVKFDLRSNFSTVLTTTTSTYLTFKVIWYDETEGKYYDIFAIHMDKRMPYFSFIVPTSYNSGQICAYFSMNDTKTEKVYVANATTGIWEQSRYISKNTTTRLLK